MNAQCSNSNTFGSGPSEYLSTILGIRIKYNMMFKGKLNFILHKSLLRYITKDTMLYPIDRRILDRHKSGLPLKVLWSEVFSKI